MTRHILVCALRLFSGVAVAVFLILSIALACSYLAGGWVPATILGTFLCASCEALFPQALFPVAGLLLCALLSFRLAGSPIRVE